MQHEYHIDDHVLHSIRFNKVRKSIDISALTVQGCDRHLRQLVVRAEALAWRRVPPPQALCFCWAMLS